MVGLGIIASRLFGLLRQRVFAHYFGDTWIADAFSAALRLGNITQNLLGEGTLSASFIPIYVQAQAKGEPERAHAFARDVLGVLLVVAAVLSFAGAALATPFTRLIVPGFEGERFDLAVHLVRIFFPMTGLLALSAWSLGVLNSHRQFFLPYAAPVLWSVSQIVAMVVGSRYTTGAALARILGYGALLGGALQRVVQLPRVRGLLGSVAPRFHFSSPDVRQAVRVFGPVVLGRGVVQISAFIDTLLASLLPVGANAVMAYAQSIYLLPLSVFGVGAAAASLPEMARRVRDGVADEASLREELGEALTRVAFTTLPTTFVFVALPAQIIGAVFQTGKFDVSATAVVSAALAGAGVGLLANASVRVLASAFYALQDTATPARLAVVRVLASIGMSYALMLRYGVTGLLFGAALAGWLEAALLALAARKRLGGLGLPLDRWWRMLVASAVAAAAGVGLTRLPWPGGHAVLVRAAGSLVGFGVVYLGAAALLRLPDVADAWRALGRKFKR